MMSRKQTLSLTKFCLVISIFLLMLFILKFSKFNGRIYLGLNSYDPNISRIGMINAKIKIINLSKNSINVRRMATCGCADTSDETIYVKPFGLTAIQIPFRVDKNEHGLCRRQITLYEIDGNDIRLINGEYSFTVK